MTRSRLRENGQVERVDKLIDRYISGCKILAMAGLAIQMDDRRIQM